MNPDLYTDEFRNFKYLKSLPADISHYKKLSANINSVQPWAEINDPHFVWTHRVEFLEQIIDLEQDTLYIVVRPDTLDDNVRCHEIVYPIIYNNLLLTDAAESTLQNISYIEHNLSKCFLASKENREELFRLHEIIFPKNDYLAMFNNKEIAMKYKCALSEFHKKNSDAISAITRLF